MRLRRLSSVLPISVLPIGLALLVACQSTSPGTTTLVKTPSPVVPASGGTSTMPVGGSVGTAPSGGTTSTGSPVCAQSINAAPELAASSVVSSAAPAVAAADWSRPHVSGEVLVLVPTGTLSAQSLSALSRFETQRLTSGVIQVATPDTTSDPAFAQSLEAAGLKTQPNFIYHSLATPNDPAFPGNAGLKTLGISAFQTYLTRIGAPAAWNFLASCGKTPVAALTAVLDSGVNGTHLDLQGRLNTGTSYVSSAPSALTDEAGHGTATAGLIGAATNNGIGAAGVTWSGKLLPVKVLDQDGNTSTETVLRGLNYAISQGAKVINMSFGVPGDPGDSALNAGLASAAQSAVLVAAAGNTPDEGVYYPASNPNVIAVGALGKSDTALGCYSARPNTRLTRKLDIVAPGGVGNCAGASYSDELLVLAPGNQYELGAGTSYAAPLVSGVVALMRAANPNLSAAKAKALLLDSVNASSGLPVLDANAAIRAATR